MPTSKQRRTAERARHEVVEASQRGLDRIAFLKEAAEALRPAVHFDGACWHTVDPATLVITSHYTNLDGSGFGFICRNEYLQDDVSKFAALAGRPRPVARLSEATGGKLERSARYVGIYRPHGWGSELRASFDAADVTWGSVMMLREAERPDFTAAEADLIASVSRHVAHGLRASMLTRAAARGHEDGPGVVVLDERDEAVSATAAAERWLAELDDGGPAGGTQMPPSVVSVAARARAAGDFGPARTRLRARSGRWLQLHASNLDAGRRGRIAVIVEPASPAQVAPLVARAYGLTAREREVVGAVLRGHTTGEIAARLWLSPYTVQDHLKSIFEKTSTSSRRELMARVFYDHAEPHVAAGHEPGEAGWPEDPRTLG